MESACRLVGSLPPELYGYVLNKTIQTLFTKTEIIRFLILNDEFCRYISIHDLTLTITENGYLKFDEDPLSNDLISLRDIVFGNKKIFAKLFENYTLSIRNLILHANIQQLAFLANHTTYIHCESLDAICMVLGPKIDMKKLRTVTLSFYKGHFSQFQTLAKFMHLLPKNAQYNLKFAISDHYDFKETINILHHCSTQLQSNYNVTFNILFFLNTTISKDSKFPTSKLVKYFSYCLFLLEKYNVNTSNIKVILKLNLQDPKLHKSETLLDLFKFIGLNFIQKLIIDSVDDSHYQFDFGAIRNLTNLKLIEVRCDQRCGFDTFGNLTGLRFLKKLIFQCDDVDFDWLSHDIPGNVETIQLFRTLKNRNDSEKSVFEVPKNIQNLIIETDLSEATIDFKRFKFNNTIHLQKIIILDYFVKKAAVNIVNLPKIPKSLKEFRFHDSNDFGSSLHENHFSFATDFDSSQMEGVYSNIDAEFTLQKKNYKCLCNYSFRILNLKSKRIRSVGSLHSLKK